MANETLMRLRVWWFIATPKAVRFAKRLRHLVKTSKMPNMNALDGRLVLVPADQLDDLLELARIATERLPDDQLSKSLRAAVSQVRLSQLVEP